jgi:hypothetical protein
LASLAAACSTSSRYEFDFGLHTHRNECRLGFSGHRLLDLELRFGFSFGLRGNCDECHFG